MGRRKSNLGGIIFGFIMLAIFLNYTKIIAFFGDGKFVYLLILVMPYAVMSLVLVIIIILAIYFIHGKRREIKAEIDYKDAEEKIRKDRIRKGYIDSVSHNQIDRMDGIKFENYVAYLLEQKGLRIEFTSSSNDKGADLIAIKDNTRWAIQCKRYSKKVGSKAIGEAHTGKAFYDCNKAMVVTNNYFTTPATETAEKIGVTLIDREKLGKWIQQVEKINKSRILTETTTYL